MPGHGFDDGQKPGLRVCNDGCRDMKHPAEKPFNAQDAQALRHPAGASGLIALPGYKTSYNDRKYMPDNITAMQGFEAAERHFSQARMNPELLMVQADQDLRNPADMLIIERWFMDPKNRSPWRWLVDGKIVGLNEQEAKAKKNTDRFDYDANVAGLEVVDRYTIRIRLKSTDFNFAYILASPTMSIVAREVIEQYSGDIKGHPVGTGPYMLAQWQRGARILLHANPGYRGFLDLVSRVATERGGVMLAFDRHAEDEASTTFTARYGINADERQRGSESWRWRSAPTHLPPSSRPPRNCSTPAHRS